MTTENPAWAKSSFCGSGACVEVAQAADGHRLVRDSKNPDVPPLRFTGEEWASFLDGAKAGEFDFD